MGQKTLDNEHMAALRCDVERCPPVLPLDVDDDGVPLEQLGHHHALALVGRNTQRRLPELVELIWIIANCGQIIDHVCVPAATILYGFRWRHECDAWEWWVMIMIKLFIGTEGK